MHRRTEPGHPGAPPRLDEILGMLTCESKFVFQGLRLHLFQRKQMSREFPLLPDLVSPTASLTSVAATISPALEDLSDTPINPGCTQQSPGLLKVTASRNTAMLKAFQWLLSIPGIKPHLSPEASGSDLLSFSPQPKALFSSSKELPALLLPQGLLQLPLLCNKLPFSYHRGFFGQDFRHGTVECLIFADVWGLSRKTL